MSPHLTIWRWGPHMAVSILHRITGSGLSVAGMIAFVWWLVAAASGPEAYATFIGHATAWYGVVVAIGLTWALIQHGVSGLRHFVMDIGAGYELRTNRMWATITLFLPALLTALVWAYILGVRA